MALQANATAPLRVLLVAGSTGDVRLLEAALAPLDEPYELSRAPDGATLEQALKEGTCDVVLASAIPHLDALNLLARLQTLPSPPPCLLLSEQPEEARTLEVVRAGAREVLTLAHLLPALRRVMSTTREARAAQGRISALEAQARAQTQFLDTLLETLPNPVFWKDRQGTLLGCNRAFERLLGQPRGALLGQALATVAPPSQTLIHLEQEADLVTSPPPQVCTAQWPTGEGAMKDLLCFREPLRDAQGLVTGLVGVLVDVTAQRDMVQELSERQALLDVITGTLVDLLALVDDQGNQIYTSPSYLSVLGYTTEELADIPTTGLLGPDDQARIAAALDRLFRDGHTQDLSYRLRHKDGSWRSFEAKAALVRNAQGATPQALFLARDVTLREEQAAQRRHLEFHLRQSQKLEAVGQLAAGIAHEINTPTQYIGDNTAFLRDNLQPMLDTLKAVAEHLKATPDPGLQGRLEALDLPFLEEELPKALQQSLEGVSRVKAIVQSMKDFSHPGSETRVPADLNHAIESTVTISRNEWKYVADLALNLDPALPPVPCFLGELNQAVLNLIVNAAHAIETALGGRDSGQMGHIEVSTATHGNEVEITVRDTGCGIPEAHRERIFESFFTTKEVGRGTGQGLAIVHAVVVQKHGGRIQLESEVGKGSAFHLFLPLANPGA